MKSFSSRIRWSALVAFSLCLTGASGVAWAVELRYPIRPFQVMSQEPGSIPYITTTQNRLVIAPAVEPKVRDRAKRERPRLPIYVMNLAKPSELPVSIPASYGSHFITSDPSGWVSVCQDYGRKIITFNVLNPERAVMIDLENQFLSDEAAAKLIEFLEKRGDFDYSDAHGTREEQRARSQGGPSGDDGHGHGPATQPSASTQPSEDEEDVRIPESLRCASVSLDVQDPTKPLLWVGSSDERMTLINPLNPKLEIVPGKDFSQVNGSTQPIAPPFGLARKGETFFGLRQFDPKKPDLQMPLVFSTQSGVVDYLVGHRRGDYSRTSMRPHYNLNVRYDAFLDSVFYLSPRKRLLLQISASQPREATAREIPTLGKMVADPEDLVSYGRCLAVLGVMYEPQRRPQWAIFETKRGYPVWVRSTAVREERILRGSIHQAVAEDGTVYVSNWTGVVEVKGLFDGLGCKP